MRHIFELDNEHATLENDYNSKIAALNEELLLETQKNNSIKTNYFTAKNEYETATLLLQEETNNREHLQNFIESLRSDHAKKLESMKLKHEQDKYIATNFTKSSNKPKLRQTANTELENLTNSKSKSKEKNTRKISTKK